MMNNISTKTTADRRGRIFVNGIFLDFEDEVDTFKELAKKYLLRELREAYLLSDPPQIRFDVK